MKKRFLVFLLLLAGSVRAERPPLIDCELFFGEPGATYLFDRGTRNLTPQYTAESSDGRGVPKHLPIVVIPHGGPWQRDKWGYSVYAQFFANRGYTVLQWN